MGEAPLNKMNVCDVLVFAQEVLTVLKSANVFTLVNGHYEFAKLNAAEIEAIAPQVEAVLTAHGFVIPVQINTVLQSLPLILQLAGVK